MKLKKTLSITLGVILLTSSLNVLANTANTAKIAINGEIRAEGFIDNGTTYIPLRSVSETLGAIVDWDSSTKTATLSKGYTTIVQRIGSDTARVNNKIVQIGAAAQIKNGSTYVPLRFVSENLGAAVNWDSKIRTVQITAEGVKSKEDTLKEKYINLSKKTRDMTEFKAVPVTDYTTWDKVPQNVEGYRLDKLRFVEMKDLPIMVREQDVYNIEIGKLDSGANVLMVTTRVTNRNNTLLLTYATKEKGLLSKRDVHIEGVREDIVKMDDNTWVVKQKYHLPNKNRDSVTPEQIEYFVLYTTSTKDSIAIKNPFLKK